MTEDCFGQAIDLRRLCLKSLLTLNVTIVFVHARSCVTCNRQEAAVNQHWLGILPSSACPARRRKIAHDTDGPGSGPTSLGVLRTIRGSSLRAWRSPMVLSHLVLAAVGPKVLVVVVVASGSVLVPILVRVLRTTAVLMRSRRVTVPSSAVVHCARTTGVSQVFAAFRLHLGLSVPCRLWAMWRLGRRVQLTVIRRLSSIRRLLVGHAGAHAICLLALRRALVRHWRSRRPPGARIPIRRRHLLGRDSN